MAPLGAARFGLGGGLVDNGKLELIETIDMAGSSTFTFSDLGSYKMHKLTLNNYVPFNNGSMSALVCEVSSNGGSSYYTSGYEYSYEYAGQALGGDARSATASGIVIGPYINDEGFGGDCLEFMGLVSSSEYLYYSFHSMDYRGDNVYSGNAITVFGSGVLQQTVAMDTLKLNDPLGNCTSGTLSLYGYSDTV